MLTPKECQNLCDTLYAGVCDSILMGEQEPLVTPYSTHIESIITVLIYGISSHLSAEATAAINDENSCHIQSHLGARVTLGRYCLRRYIHRAARRIAHTTTLGDIGN